MRMVIVAKESIPLGFRVNSIAHGVLMAHLEWEKEPQYQEWLKNSFKKVSCVANDKEFEALKKQGRFIVVQESALDKAEVVLVFFPDTKENLPKGLSFLRLLK